MSEALALPNKERISEALKRRFFLRLHMTFILGATFAAGGECEKDGWNGGAEGAKLSVQDIEEEEITDHCKSGEA